ncbi:RNA methyltransferase, TrmA family [hydrothermal vent metagenome]|uniref:RNA methyltransferase, TrmA family n=1 Tax=hydrothermal vent metagenome TaxID=652676 RepID=A0A3B1CTL9_9ZZZZ
MRLEALIPLYGGYTLSRDDGVIFIRGALPGEIVEADVVEKKKDYSVASVKEVIESSPDRIVPACPVFGICGGCHYQYIAGHRQVSMKEEVVLDCIERIGKTALSLDSSLISSPWHYRKRAQFKVSADGRIGFYRTLSHDVVEFEKCLLLSPEINTFLEKIKSVGVPSGVKEIHVQSGDILLAAVKGDRVDTGIAAERLRDAGVSGISFENGTVDGVEQICLDLNGYHYMVSPKSFFQVNWELNNKLLSVISSFVSSIRPEKVVDLYCGAGNFSIPLSPFAGEIVGVEENPFSCRDGRENIELNRIGNIRLVNKRVEDFDIGKGTDMIILDPPRAGLTKRVLRGITEASPSWLVYVSCNPSTFARDIERLKEHYVPDSVRVIDMFPQTYHIEVLGILKKTS